MTSKLATFCLVLCLLAATAHSQDLFFPGVDEPFFDSVEGRAHPHIYSTIIYGSPDLDLDPLATTFEFTGTIPEGVFDSSENIYTAAGNSSITQPLFI